MGNSLVRYTGSLYHRAEAWAGLSDEDLRREVTRASGSATPRPYGHSLKRTLPCTARRARG